MKYNILYFVLVAFILFSCKKVERPQATLDEKSETSKAVTKPTGNPATNIVPDVGQPTYSKFNLQSLGNGVYSGLLNGHHMTVDGIFYKTIDDYGNPIPVRDGDPIYGVIYVSYSDGGSTVAIQPNGSSLQNHFAVQYGVFGSGNGAPDLAAYNTAYSSALSSYRSAYAVWQQLPNGPPPQLNSPSIINYLTTSGAGAHTETYTGKLIRSNTGTTTFAVATENYPIPPPLLPQ